MRNIFLFLFIGLAFYSTNVTAQKKLSNEMVWGPMSPFGTETVREVRSMKDGEHFTQLEYDKKEGMVIAKYSYKTYEKVGIVARAKDMKPEGRSKAISIQDYEFNADETKLLIANNIRPIYRYSYKANFYIYDIKGKTTTPLSEKEGQQRLAEFSPNGNKVAFVRQNNMFIKDLKSGEETQVTTDGEMNMVINGATDWVHEEEFAFAKGFQWSANGTWIAYYKFDESEVKEYQMPIYGDLYPYQYTFKYPKAGEQNAEVTLHAYYVGSKKTIQLPTAVEGDYYLPRIKWTKDDHKLCVLRMNRHQSKLEYLLFNLDPAMNPNNTVPKPEIVYTEKSETYIEIDDNLIFLEDGNHFIRTSEKDGYNHIYKIGLDGTEEQVTKGKWDVIEFKGVDNKKDLVYYTSAENGATQKDLFVIGLNGKKKKQLSTSKGQNDPIFSKGMKYYINYHTDANTPEYVSLHNASGKKIKVLEDNAELKERMEGFNLSEKEFLTIKGADVDLNAWMIKPPNFDPDKEYPVYVNIYCGPGHNTVLDGFDGRNYFWHQYLAQEGYIVFSVDTRGTMYRGAEFKKSTYMELGKLETEDLIAVSKALGEKSFIDKDRIGIQGWSYGGYMTSLAMTKGADYYAMGIAVAPVTNWKYYDTIYTERFMRTPQENDSGYEDNSPINHVDKLKGPYLIVHGGADDNVHLQNAMDMVNALVANNKDFDMFVYPNRNHGIYGGFTRLHLFNKMFDFVRENLLKLLADIPVKLSVTRWIAIIILILTGGIVTAQSDSASASVRWLSWEEAITASKLDSRKIFVYIYTEATPAAAKMEFRTFTDSTVVNYLNKDYYPVKLNAEQTDTINYKGVELKTTTVGDYQFHELAVSLLNGRMDFPAMIILDESEKRINIKTGFQNATALANTLMFFYHDGHLKKNAQGFGMTNFKCNNPNHPHGTTSATPTPR